MSATAFETFVKRARTVLDEAVERARTDKEWLAAQAPATRARIEQALQQSLPN